jgi:polysaccharide deacetylase 2 family uncharacterized protein YibQ
MRRPYRRVLSRRGLFFVDSRTTDATVAERTAEEESRPVRLTVGCSSRRRDRGAVRAQLDEAVAHARNEGGCIAIGHPYPRRWRAGARAAAHGGRRE